MEKMHNCQAPGCKRTVSTRYLMCHDHWYALPLDIRLDVWKWFSAKARRVRGADQKAHQSAETAIRWIRNRDAKTSPQKALFK